MTYTELRLLSCPLCAGIEITSYKEGKTERIYPDCCFPDGLVTESKYKQLLKQQEKKDPIKGLKI